ncbi:MAG: type IV pilus twitching motility protein PilT [Blastocatellia bacterium]|nr:type IV pilus twitching motility protein PilT [Blastocatellia bacterium]MBL8193214.1 type IV pilus twitching motility protein PilT [Blastocatellia bacterium]MBN8722270.1 type IV pilus twitching motility protein PilT [Acidobacteriota bacterium]
MTGFNRTGFGINTERQKLRQDIDKLLERTLKMRGSDLHVATGAPPIVRRFGTLMRVEGEILEIEKARAIVREILTDEQFRQFEKTGDLDFSYEVIGVGRFRGNVLRQNRGIDLTFHVVPAEIMSPETLGLPPLVRELTHFHQGLILITGAAGQGKSTTISSLVDVINSERALHILTVEDPIEFVHPIDKKAIVNQREVGRHTKSFANALRAALREDPDVIVVGEMRDLETISLAVTASETGHLVMGTLMTSSAHQTVDRILESFPPAQQNQIRAMLSDSLRAVISQRLLPMTDNSGMVLAAEILLGTPAVANLIREKKTFQIPSIIQTNRHLGMRRMDDALLELVQAGKVNPQKALDFAFDKKAFEASIKRI